MAITLDQLVETGVKQARHVLLTRREKQLKPFYALFNDKNEITLLPCQFNDDHDKDVTVAAVKATAALTGANKALYMSEGWMLHLPKPLTPWHAKQQMENLPRPAESPDRIEIVQIIATDGTNTKARALQMIRNKPGGKLMALVPMPELEDCIHSGRMIDGIIPSRKEARP